MKRLLFLFSLLLILAPLQAQKGAINRANKLFDKLAFSDAAAAYEDILAKNEVSEGKSSLAEMDERQILAQLGDAYRLMQNFSKAEVYYETLVVKYSLLVDWRYHLYLGQMLKANGKCDQAKEHLNFYTQHVPDDRRGLVATYSCDDETSFRQREKMFLLERLGINSAASDFGPTFYDEGIVFSSSRETDDLVKRKHAWTNSPFLDLYYAQGEDAESFTPPIRFDKRINRRFNEGPVTFRSEGTEMFITRNPTNGKSSNHQVTLEIAKAVKEDDKWREAELLSFNSKEYSIAHPTLSSDGRYIYFSSDMPGGYGGTDIYYSERFHGGWSEAFNLGAAVNTAGNEGFPFLYEDETLYFASDGHGGVGGLDVFQINKKGTVWGSPRNMGYPVNSETDDFSLIWNGDERKGYFSSNRSGGVGSDDIYLFNRTAFMLMGKVYDWQSRELLSNATIKLLDDMGIETVLYSDSTGAFNFELSPDNNYEVIISYPGYQQRTKEIYGVNVVEDILFDVLISKENCIPFSGTVVSEDSYTPQAEIPVVITNIKNGEKWKVKTDASGTFLIECTDPDGQYVATIPYKEVAVSIEEAVQLYAPLISEPALVDLCDFEPVFYDDDAATIRAESEAMRNEILRQLLANPALEVALSSHTDVEISSTENHKISKERTDGAAGFLIEHGIAARRIHLNYYGESEFSAIFTEGAAPGENNSRTECRCIKR